MRSREWLRRRLRGALVVCGFGLVVFAAEPSAQSQGIPAVYYGRPLSPLSPTDPKQCQALDREWQRVRDQTYQQHEACLEAVRRSKRDCPDDTKGTGCSCVGCADYHDSSRLGTEEVAACNKAVTAYQDAERDRKQREAKMRQEQERMEAEAKAQRQKEADERTQRDAQRAAEKTARADAERERREREREQARRDSDRLERAAERSRQARDALRERTAAREEEREQAEQQRDAASDRYDAQTRDVADRVSDLGNQLQQGIADLAAPVDQLVRADVGAPSLADFDFLEPALPEFDIDVGAFQGVVRDGLIDARSALVEWGKETVTGAIIEQRDLLIEHLIQDRSVSEVAIDILDRNVDGSLGIERLSSRVFDNLTGEAVDEIKSDLSDYINERLRTNVDRVTGRPWAGDLGNKIVEHGVSFAVNSVVEAMRQEVTERASQAWDQMLGRPAPPPENTYARAEYDLWRHAEPLNLLTTALPLRGPEAVKGFYDWSQTLVDKFSTFMGFAVDEIAGTQR